MPERSTKLMLVVEPWDTENETIDEWHARINDQVRDAHEMHRSVLVDASTENARMLFGCEYATKFYKFLRTFCTAQSVRLVASHLRSLASEDLYADGKRRDAALKDDG